MLNVLKKSRNYTMSAVPTAKDARPYILDSPRFFDDQPLSTWHVRDSNATKPIAISKDAVSAKAVTNVPQLENNTSEWPDPEYEDSPITIEAVRGANGAQDDSWTILVDGVRCKLFKRQTSIGDSKEVYVCKLPGGVARKPLTVSTKVRSLILGVRLESEAASPNKVHLEVHQVLQSDEMVSQPAGVYTRNLIHVQEVKPYRVSETQAYPVELVYPVRSPSQSVLGIVSFERIKRWEEKARATRFYNTGIGMYNYARQSVYVEQTNAYLQRQTATRDLQVASNAIQGFLNVTPAGRNKMLGEGFKAFNSQMKKMKGLKRPTRPSEIPQRRLPSEPDNQNQKTKNFVIGGDASSAARELSTLFQKLTKQCIQARGVVEQTFDDLNKKDANGKYTEREKYGVELDKLLPGADESSSLKYKLHALRQSVMATEGSKTSAFLDALLTCKPYPLVKDLLQTLDSATIEEANVVIDQESGEKVLYIDNSKFINTKNFSRKYNVCKVAIPDPNSENASENASGTYDIEINENTEPRIVKMSDEQRKQLDKAKQNELKEEQRYARDSKAPFMFLYERLPINRRKTTSVHLVYRLVIRQDENNTLDDFVVEFEASEEDGIVANSVLSGHVQDVLDMDASANEFIDCIFGMYAERNRIAKSKDAAVAAGNLAGSAVKNVAKRTVATATLAVPTSVKQGFKLLFLEDKFNVESYLGNTINPCSLEDIVSEVRLMARGILPEWPPTPYSVESELQQARLEIDANTDTKKAIEELKKVRGNKSSTPEERDQKNREISEGMLSIMKVDSTVQLKEQQQKLEAVLKKEDEIINKAALYQQMTLANQDVPDKKFSELANDLVDLNNQLLELGLIADPDVVLSQNEAAYDLNMTLVVRTLPQILIPSTSVNLTFKVPENPDPPSFYDARGLVNSANPRGGWMNYLSMRNIVTVGAVVGTGIALSGPQGIVAAAMAAITQGVLPAITLAGGGAAGAGAGAAAAGGGLLTGSVAAAASAAATAVAGGVAYKNGYLDQMLNDLKYKLGYLFISNIVEGERIRQRGNSERIQAYKSARIAIRMVPASSCITSIKVAFEGYKKTVDDLFNSLSTYKLEKRPIAVAFSNVTQRRVQFLEFYTPNTDDSGSIIPIADNDDVTELHQSDDWNVVPNGSAIQLFPPLDVSESLFDVQVKRDIPVQQAIQFTIGRDLDPNTQTPAQLSARVAFIEIVHSLQRDRRVLNGEHLSSSLTSSAISLVDNATKLILSAYGSNSGVTLVDGDDSIWTCFSGGVAARLALRHLNVFLASQTEFTDSNRINNSIKFWTSNRRSLVEMFSAHLKEEAVNYANQQSRLALKHVMRFQSTNEVAHVAREMMRTYARTMSLSNPKNINVVATAVASSLQGALFLHGTKNDDDSIYQTALNAIALEERDALAFEDQKATLKPEQKWVADSMREATWASRRINVRESRKHRVGEGNVDLMIEKLASLDLKSDQKNENATYYIPYGSNIFGSPATLMFDVVRTGKHLVWLEDFDSSLSHLIHNGMVATPTSTLESQKEGKHVLIETFPVGTSGEVLGNARHPLCISIDSTTGTMKLPLSRPPSTWEAYYELSQQVECTSDSKLNIDSSSLLNAVRTFQESEDSCRRLSEKLEMMKTLGYNTERMLHAVSLAYSLKSEATDQQKIHIRLYDAKHALSTALALSIFHSATGIVFSSFDVNVPIGNESDSVRQTLQNMQSRVQSAMKNGIKCILLAEACLAM